MNDMAVAGGREFSVEMLGRIEALAGSAPEMGLTGVAVQVCQWQHWTRATGEPAVASCAKALRTLQERGRLVLPWPKRKHSGIRAVTPAVVLPGLQQSIEGSVKRLVGLEVLLVEQGRSTNGDLFKEMVGGYHYLGYQRLVGQQLRYLLRCRQGWLGAIWFAASAYQVAARDEFIGWTKDARLAHLSEVVGNARFVLLPWVRVKNLASKVLSLVTKRLAQDWQDRYGYRPLLVETFVDRQRFRGTCYRGARWTYVGRTQGRGRQDANREAALASKDILVCPLTDGWQRRLCRIPPRKKARASTQPDVGGATGARHSWVEQEFSDTPFRDPRLHERLIVMLKDFWSRPQGSILQACSGSVPKVRAAYRFLNHQAVTMEKILQPHIASTVERIREACADSVVLAVQDTTTLNYTARLQTDGLGYIGTSPDGAQGYLVHDTLALTPEGLALGLLDVQAWARKNEDFGKKKQKSRPIEAKESIKWLKSFEAVAEAQRLLPKTRVVSVGDREGDVFELFALARSRRDHPELLVRAEHDRYVEHEGKRKKLWEAIESTDIQCHQIVDVPRRTARRQTKGQRARRADLGLRFARMSLLPPQGMAQKERPIPVWVIQAVEQAPPRQVEPLEWVLLSTLPVTTVAEAQEKLHWYTCRFLIEVYHKTFKSGCGIEERQHHRIESLQNALALDMVVAWRIMYLLGLGRSTPNVPCTVVFEQDEWKALYAFVNETVRVPDETPTLSDAMAMVARLGGFLGRKSDGHPGVVSAWKGLTRLEDITVAWRIFRNGAKD